MSENGLAESVEQIVIEALAEMYASMNRSPANEPDSSVVTRDIINAIADGLSYPPEGVLLTRMEATRFKEVGRFLRSQATEGDENG